MSLYSRRFRDEFHSTLTWSITLGLSGLAIMLFGLFLNNSDVTKSFSEIFKKMPSIMHNMFGTDQLNNFSSYYLLGMAFNTIAPLLLLVFSSLAILGLYTREAGQGNLEFLFSLPIGRLKLIGGRILVFLTSLGILQLCFCLGLAIGTLLIGDHPDVAAMIWAAADLFLLSFCLGGLAFLLSLATNDYSRGILLVLGVLLGLFVLNLGLGDNKGLLAYMNPYHYFDTSKIFTEGSVPWLNYLGFALSGLALWAGGIRIYVRKQV